MNFKGSALVDRIFCALGAKQVNRFWIYLAFLPYKMWNLSSRLFIFALHYIISSIAAVVIRPTLWLVVFETASDAKELYTFSRILQNYQAKLHQLWQPLQHQFWKCHQNQMYCIKKVILFANFLRFGFKLSPHIWYFCSELDIVFGKFNVELFQL